MNRTRTRPRMASAVVAMVTIVTGGVLGSCDGGDAVTTTEASTTTQAAESTTSSTMSIVQTDSATTTTELQPEGARVQQVQIDAGDMALVGDLYLPAGAGPHPGVVLVHGSGPQNRNQEVIGQLNMAFGFTIPVFAEIAEGLQSAGYAVLTYDKRSCGTFNGCAGNDYPLPPDDLTIDRFVDDAAAALDALAQRPDVDAARLAVIGHSQGAGFVPELMVEDGSVRAGVLLAGPHDPPDVLVAAQALSTRDLLETMGLSAEQIDAAVTPLDDAAQQLASIRDGEPPDAPILGASVKFWESWMTQADAAPAIATGLDRALLVLGGELDTNVPPVQAELWRATLAASSNDHEVTVVACITHALNCLAESDLPAITLDDIGEHVAPEVIATVVAFLDDRV
ncbi:MAG: alpha/beta fold hydrolase [Actinomycetota bacterium]